jgi:hypothetical protein
MGMGMGMGMGRQPHTRPASAAIQNFIIKQMLRKIHHPGLPRLRLAMTVFLLQSKAEG